MTNEVEDKIAYLRVRNEEDGNEGVLPDTNGVLCSLCRTEKADQDLVISGHTIGICSKCVASLNTFDLEQLACGQN